VINVGIALNPHFARAYAFCRAVTALGAFRSRAQKSYRMRSRNFRLAETSGPRSTIKRARCNSSSKRHDLSTTQTIEMSAPGFIYNLIRAARSRRWSWGLVAGWCEAATPQMEAVPLLLDVAVLARRRFTFAWKAC
jgi:hypothetical protein